MSKLHEIDGTPKTVSDLKAIAGGELAAFSCGACDTQDVHAVWDPHKPNLLELRCAICGDSVLLVRVAGGGLVM